MAYQCWNSRSLEGSYNNLVAVQVVEFVFVLAGTGKQVEEGKLYCNLTQQLVNWPCWLLCMVEKIQFV